MKNFFLSILLLVTSIACEYNSNDIFTKPGINEFGVNEIIKDYNFKLNSNKWARTTKDKREKTLNRLVRWDQYISVLKDKEQRIVVPFTLEEEIFTNWMDGKVIPYSSLTSLVVSKKNGEYNYEVVTKYPDEDWLKRKSTKFSGQIIVEDINGEFIKGYEYKKNEIQPIVKTLKNERTTYEKVCSYINWYTCVSSNGVFYGCNFNYTEEIGCIELQDQDHDKFSVLDGKWYPNFGGRRLLHHSSIF
ncbi:hypothetical protein [Dyadobacter sp. CY323]|uniref:hypothetical protein n=1 Tax=Dyadobacter sp. CY323 TaxID=2907302 RepID=UPI001F405223|nr:hypothetical protein [Dyadobacter sp. CY323]MCE6989634.1 hypothetical protein [Dyadobacter sp. CY323]